MVEDPTEDKELVDQASEKFAALFTLVLSFIFILSRGAAPKVLITTCLKPHREVFEFVRDLMTLLPSVEFYTRRDYKLKQILEWAVKRVGVVQLDYILGFH